MANALWLLMSLIIALEDKKDASDLLASVENDISVTQTQMGVGVSPSA